MSAHVEVECYSGHTYAQEPRAFLWEGGRYRVAGVEARWRTPDGPAFRVRVESGERFDLHYQPETDTWSLFLLEKHEELEDNCSQLSSKETHPNPGQGGPPKDA